MTVAKTKLNKQVAKIHSSYVTGGPIAQRDIQLCNGLIVGLLCRTSTLILSFSSLREQVDLGWPWWSDGGGSGCVRTVVSPWTPAQSEDRNTGQYQNTIPNPQRPAPRDAQDLVEHQWQHQLENSLICSQKSKCGSWSACWCSGDKVLPEEDNWSEC